MAALADAVDEEVRSEGLAVRSRDLLSDYGGRKHAAIGGSIRDDAVFVRRLQEVADQADKARRDASDQAAWQVQSLAAAETRAIRFEESLSRARRVLEETQLRREDSAQISVARKLARKLQNDRQPQSDKSEEA